MKNAFILATPEDTARQLAGKARALRLARNWKKATLAERSGVSLGSLQRFERTGLVSLQNLLKLAFALGRLADFEQSLQPPQAGSIAELEAAALSDWKYFSDEAMLSKRTTNLIASALRARLSNAF